MPNKIMEASIRLSKSQMDPNTPETPSRCYEVPVRVAYRSPGILTSADVAIYLFTDEGSVFFDNPTLPSFPNIRFRPPCLLQN